MAVIFILSSIEISRADIGASLDQLQSEYGSPAQTRPTPTGKIVAFKADNMVVMGELGPDGRARNVAYRVPSGLNESLISDILSRNSGVTGSFYKVDKPRLSSTLDKLSQMKSQSGGNIPPELQKLSAQMNPQVVAQLKSTLSSISDLRATHDGKYIAMIDPRGSVLVMEINGPMLPLAE